MENKWTLRDGFVTQSYVWIACCRVYNPCCQFFFLCFFRTNSQPSKWKWNSTVRSFRFTVRNKYFFFRPNKKPYRKEKLNHDKFPDIRGHTANCACLSHQHDPTRNKLSQQYETRWNHGLRFNWRSTGCRDSILAFRSKNIDCVM